MPCEVVVADWLHIEQLDLGEHVARIGSANVFVRVRDDRVTAVEIDRNFFATDEAARTRP